MVAIDAHGVAAIRKNHFSAGLQADPTLIFSLQFPFCNLPLIVQFLPDHPHAATFLLTNIKL